MHKYFLPLLLLFFVSSAQARQHDKFYASSWDAGVHLFAGGGINGSLYNSDAEKQNQGPGLHFKTDFGWFLDSKWALEAGSHVMFTKVKEYLIWDTLLTVGVRHRFHGQYFGRIFYGQAPTVFYLDDVPSFYDRRGATRVQYTGPVYGFALGEMREAKDGKVWFIEAGTSFQSLDDSEGVKDQGNVPEVVFSGENRNVIKIYTIYVSVGVLVF